MTENETRSGRQAQVIDDLIAFSATQSELGREFARRMRMHPTDSTAIVEILRAEHRGVPLTPARLAERIGMTSSATSTLLNRLENAGHVTRTREHADRRLVTLHSSSTVHERAGEFFEPLRVQLDAVMQDYGMEQLELINTVVSRLRTTIDEYAHGSDSATAGSE